MAHWRMKGRPYEYSTKRIIFIRNTHYRERLEMLSCAVRARAVNRIPKRAASAALHGGFLWSEDKAVCHGSQGFST
eukprot:6545836-Ditylum_brightwellii.AAC.1